MPRIIKGIAVVFGTLSAIGVIVTAWWNIYGMKNSPDTITASSTYNEEPKVSEVESTESVKGVKVQNSIPTVNPDPIVSCNTQYHGSIQMKKSQCDVTFECQLKDGWYLYTSREKCSNDQKVSYGNKAQVDTTSHYTPPVNNYVVTPLPTIEPYVPWSVPSSDPAQDVEVCKNTVKNKYYQLLQSCTQLAASAREFCENKYHQELEAELASC